MLELYSSIFIIYSLYKLFNLIIYNINLSNLTIKFLSLISIFSIYSILVFCCSLIISSLYFSSLGYLNKLILVIISLSFIDDR